MTTNRSSRGWGGRGGAPGAPRGDADSGDSSHTAAGGPSPRAPCPPRGVRTSWAPLSGRGACLLPSLPVCCPQSHRCRDCVGRFAVSAAVAAPSSPGRDDGPSPASAGAAAPSPNAPAGQTAGWRRPGQRRRTAASSQVSLPACVSICLSVRLSRETLSLICVRFSPLWGHGTRSPSGQGAGWRAPPAASQGRPTLGVQLGVPAPAPRHPLPSSPWGGCCVTAPLCEGPCCPRAARGKSSF